MERFRIYQFSIRNVIILLFNLLIAIIYSRGKNNKKNCWNNSLIKSTAYLFLFRQKWFLKGVLIHWMSLISPDTGEVLIHEWFSTGGILNLGNLNSPLHWNCIKSCMSKSGISFVGLELILTKNESAKHFSSILRMSGIH